MGQFLVEMFFRASPRYRTLCYLLRRIACASVTIAYHTQDRNPGKLQDSLKIDALSETRCTQRSSFGHLVAHDWPHISGFQGFL